MGEVINSYMVTAVMSTLVSSQMHFKVWPGLAQRQEELYQGPSKTFAWLFCVMHTVWS